MGGKSTQDALLGSVLRCGARICKTLRPFSCLFKLPSRTFRSFTDAARLPASDFSSYSVAQSERYS